MTAPTTHVPGCYECGNDEGPWSGLCSDCIEELYPDSDPPPFPPTPVLGQDVDVETDNADEGLVR